MAKQSSEGALETYDSKLALAAGWHKEKGGTTGSGDSIYIKQGYCFYVERKKPGKKQQSNQAAFEKMITTRFKTDYYVLDASDLSGIQAILIEQEEKRLKLCTRE